MTDDGGVLGNLPRSRPGQRSEKRTGANAAKPASRPKPRKPAPPKAAPPPPSPAHEPSADPVGGAIRTAAGVAGIGARVAGGMAREVLRRIPRP
jgi:hypothetical protein